jgi:hypothetical protein
VIQRHAILLARLLQCAQALQLGLVRDDLLMQRVAARHHLIECALPFLQRHAQLARFALHRQRSSALLVAAGHRLAVIANAIRQQEV